MKRKFVPLLCLLAIVQSAAAQEQYIELVLTDTMLVEPQQWYYYVTIEKSYDIYDTAMTMELDGSIPPIAPAPPKATPQKPAADPLATVRSLALANGGEVLKDTSITYYTVYPSYSTAYGTTEEPQALNIRFTTRTGLQRFVQAIGKVPDVRGQISGGVHPQLAQFNDALDAKIMEKARAKAERMAQLSGRRLGKVLLVSEVTELDGRALKGVFETLLRTEKLYGRSGPGGNMSLDNLLHPDKIKLEQTLRFRFALQ